ncbi:MAG: hypothetical protein ACO3IJ_04595, partial [Steroidobacteraceae bacterium]
RTHGADVMENWRPEREPRHIQPSRTGSEGKIMLSFTIIVALLGGLGPAGLAETAGQPGSQAVG